MQYKFELNLQRMALGAKAVSLWERPHIKNKVREFFLHEYINRIRSRDDQEENEEKWANLTKEVLNQLDPRVLPKILESKLIYVVREVGVKIYNWHECIKENLSYNVDYAHQIYWSPYGSIDQVKIFKSFWLDNSSLSTGNRGVDISRLFRSACNYVLEEHINNLLQQVPQEIQEGTFYTESIYEEYKFHLIAYWVLTYYGELHHLIRYLKRVSYDPDKLYDYNHSVEENMFRLSVAQGYELATKYFWNKLSDEAKDRNMFDSVHMVIKGYGSIYCDIRDYKREQYTDICAFLLSQMSISQQQELFKSYNSSILRIFLSHWPWQEFFIPTLDSMWSYLGTGDYQSVLNEIMNKICQDNKLGYVIKNSKYQRILHEIWHKSPACLKQQIDQSDSYSSNITTQLLDLWDLSTLKLIINDQDMVQRRSELIDKGCTKYEKLIREDKYELVDQFIEEILKQEEVKVFKHKIDIWDYFIRGDFSTTKIGGRYHEFKIVGKCRDRYDLADKLLDWQTESLAEREELKSKIDYIKILYYFIVAEKYDLADKFLDWRFKSAEEIKDCKNSFKDDKFSTDQIYKLWQLLKEDVEIAREKSDKFLNWFLDSEEEIAWFKQEKLIRNDELKEILRDKFIGYNHFEIIEDFLEWCLLPQEEIKQLKQMIVDSTIWQKCEYNIAGGFLDITESFVKWSFDTEEQKLEFIKKFMLLDDGIESCNSFIRRVSDMNPHNTKPTLEERIVKFKKFIDFWIKPLENFYEVKNKLESYVTCYHEEEQIENHQIFMSVLDNLVQSNEIIDIMCIGDSSS